MKKTLVVAFLAFIFSGCGVMKSTESVNLITLTGKVEKLGITSYRYGTHSIRTQGQIYALKSAGFNLDNYLDRQVTLKGTKVAGYPLEGGPELIEVVNINGQ
ncbi:hypothetical protein [Pedobacter jamesrossensis]|uniref:Uncharacterized protein n=1 Tax=Pedobacter jamesrossensis TaxID=1908238 RepID=A0ABV8NJ66_9SPHI